MSCTTTVKGDVWCLSLCPSGAHNSFGVADFAAVCTALREADEAGARSLVITSEGSAFSAGADVRGMATALEEGRQRTYIGELVDAAHATVHVLRSGPPSVVAVNGVVAGASLGLICSADLRIASEAASFVSGFAGIGVTPDSSLTWSLPRLVGGGRATEMILGDRRLSADEALAWGLVSEVVAPESLTIRALDLAQQLAAGPSEALRRSRELIAQGWSSGLDAHLGREARSVRATSAEHEFAEGVSAFVARRPADFRSARRGLS